MTLQAVILVGGLGTRLRQVSGDLPKAMVSVGGRPFLEHVLSGLEVQGIKHAVLAVGFRRDVIRTHFGDRFGGIRLDYAEEDAPLGTGGATLKALRTIGPSPAFVLNGDTWIDLDYAAMLNAHAAAGARLSIAVRAVDDLSRFGAVEIEYGRIVRFHEKDRSGPGMINAGVYVMQSSTFDAWAFPDAFSLERDLFERHLEELRPLAFVAGGRFIDIGVPEDLRRAQDFFAPDGAKT
ncbi:MAG: nucleotidyltransferase family protein [Hyphomicrobiaceae bacterium]